MMENYALVTGASKGIGREIALQLAQLGYPLLLVSRNDAELSLLAASVERDYKVKALWLAVDLSTSNGAQQVANWCESESFKIEILINNAGYGLWGNFDTLDLEAQLNMISLNVTAQVALTSLLLPLLKQAGQGYILNVASTSAYQAVPTLAVYAATKSFMLSFSRALSYELRDSPVSVSCLSPGPTDTDFTHRAGLDALKDLADKFNMSPTVVAKIALKGMFKKKVEILPGFLNAAGAKLVAFVPKRLIEKAIGKLYKVPGK
ncbi:SDR family NAD(P)-dependent oxidoreductase [Mucilaginibacter sp. OK098]|uniref:SDR family NAD(P)-dependent oxidoreductase n=1 Tax=Mucilaginibacter sp. OK098 TaxID=1855297 RepID=UPI00093543B6|nr:SDR family oxidoreductase [Mucilaginibacter sp. OK098]